MEKVIGTVIPGAQKGRTWEFPTANIKWKPLPKGVYQELYWGTIPINNIIYTAVCWHVTGSILECHILDFEGDIYGKELEVSLIKKVPLPTPPNGAKKFKDNVEKFYHFKETIKNQSP